MFSELQHTLRSLARAPGFTVTFIVTLALGIGVATAVFSQAERVLFPRTSMADPKTLVVIDHYDKERNRTIFPPQLAVAAWRRTATSFADLIWVYAISGSIVVNGEPSVTTIAQVPPNYFAQLQVRPVAGRTFLPDEDQPGADQVVVLSRLACARWFGEPADAIGKQITVDGVRCQVVGVLGTDFRSVERHTAHLVYRPARLAADPSARAAASSVAVLGRLKPGITPEQAAAELGTLEIPAVPPRYAALWKSRVPTVTPVRMASRPHVVRMHLIYLGVVALLFAIALASALNLMLARTVGRRGEIAVRLALGGSRARILRLLAGESLALNLIAGAAGLLLAHWLVPLIQALTDASGTLAVVEGLNPRALPFAIGASLVSGIAVALLTAWRTMRTDLRGTLQHGSTIGGDGRGLRLLRNGLIVFQTAIAVVLLAGTGLLLRSLQRLQEIQLGYETGGRYIVATTPLAAVAIAEIDAHRRQVMDTLLTVPGIRSVSYRPGLMTGIEGKAALPDRPDLGEFAARLLETTDDYRHMVGIPLRAGRDIGDYRFGNPPVFLVNETLAHRAFGSAQAAVGRPLSLLQSAGRDPIVGEIVGVVGDTFQGNPRRGLDPMVYFPSGAGGLTYISGLYLIHVPGAPPPDFARSVKQTLYRANPTFGVAYVSPLADEVRAFERADHRARVLLQLTSLFALALTVLGLFAVMSYAVARQRAEFGLRLTLGATPQLLFRLVLGRGLKLTLLGLLLGSGAAWGLSRFIASMLYETKPHDPLVFGAVAMVLACTALAALWFPARRAMRANPAELLRVG